MRATSGAGPKGVGDGRDQIGGAGTQCAQAHARAAGQAPVRVGHVGPALLVADGNELDRGRSQGFIEVERFLAGDTEDVFHALGFEALDEDFGSFAFCHVSPVSNRNLDRPTVSRDK